MKRFICWLNGLLHLRKQASFSELCLKRKELWDRIGDCKPGGRRFKRLLKELKYTDAEIRKMEAAVPAWSNTNGRNYSLPDNTINQF